MEKLKQQISKCFYYLIDFFAGTHLFKKLDLLRRYEKRSKKNIVKYQYESLKKIISEAYEHVPFYREKYMKANINPKDLRTLNDISKFPYLTKTEIRQYYTSMIDDRYDIKKLKYTTSSGSTGEPKIFYYDTETYGWRLASMYFGWQKAGFRFGDKWLRISMAERNNFVFKMFNFFSRCEYFSLTDFNENKYGQIRQILEKEKPRMIYSYSSALYVVADYLNRKGVSYDFVKSVIVQGDMLFPKYREIIEKVFKTKVIDMYGGDGIVVSGQCTKGNYHIHDLGVLIEFVNDKGEHVSSGKVGKILVTDLHNKVMPIIRYEIADLGKEKKGKCSCGSSFSMMGNPLGRDTDIIQLSNGQDLVVHHFTGVLEHLPEVLHFQVREQAKDELLIYLKVTKDFTKSIQDKMAKDLAYYHKGGAKVRFKLVKDIPLERSNKRRLVISKGFKI